MPEQQTITYVALALALGWIFWMDVRRLIKPWWRARQQTNVSRGSTSESPQRYVSQFEGKTITPPEDVKAPQQLMPQEQIVSSDAALLKPNYEAWDQIDEIDLYQAACLWAEVEPPPSYEFDLPPAASACSDMLSNAISYGSLAAYQEDLSGKTLRAVYLAPYGCLQRSDLLTFAEKTNQRPKFLFPEER